LKEYPPAMCRALAAELKSWFQNQKFDRSLELDHAFLERCRAMNARQFTSQIGRDFAAKYKRSREFKQAASSAPTSLRGENIYIYIYLYSYIWYTNYICRCKTPRSKSKIDPSLRWTFWDPSWKVPSMVRPRRHAGHLKTQLLLESDVI
jgi:hypothetical protein